MENQSGKSYRADPRAANNKNAIKKSYLITIPHPVFRRLRKKTTPLTSPSSFTREQVEKVFFDAAQRPVYGDKRNQHHACGVDLEQMAIFMEYHKPRPGSPADADRKIHFHVAVQAKRSFRFLPLKRAIRARARLETHWSCDHEGYFSALKYCALPSPTKVQADLDPEPRLWAKGGTRKPLFEACQEPVTIAALTKRREKAVAQALEEGRSEPRPTDMDLYAAIVKGGFRNTPDDQHAWKKLVAHLKDSSPSLYM